VRILLILLPLWGLCNGDTTVSEREEVWPQFGLNLPANQGCEPIESPENANQNESVSGEGVGELPPIGNLSLIIDDNGVLQPEQPGIPVETVPKEPVPDDPEEEVPSPRPEPVPQPPKVPIPPVMGEPVPEPVIPEPPVVPPTAQEPVQISLNNKRRGCRDISILLSSTIGDLLIKARDAYNFDAAKPLYVFFNGKELQPHETLSSSGIKENDVLRIKKKKGGCKGRGRHHGHHHHGGHRQRQDHGHGGCRMRSGQP